MYCKINTTAYNPNKKVKENERFPFHNQDLRNPELYKQMIQTIVDLEINTDPGVDMDSYMMVYKDKWGLWEEWQKYDGQKIKRGTFIVVVEDRDGGNYQMFNKAFQMFKGRYDWWLFTCDDLLVLGDQYYKKILDKWEPGVGYIALQGGGEMKMFEGQSHVQGSIGLTHRIILEQVCAANEGELPHPKAEPWTQEANIHQGEIPFTNKIIQLGYHFKNYNDSQKWSVENLCFPYWNYIHGQR